MGDFTLIMGVFYWRGIAGVPIYCKIRYLKENFQSKQRPLIQCSDGQVDKLSSPHTIEWVTIVLRQSACLITMIRLISSDRCMSTSLLYPEFVDLVWSNEQSTSERQTNKWSQRVDVAAWSSAAETGRSSCHLREAKAGWHANTVEMEKKALMQ